MELTPAAWVIILSLSAAGVQSSFTNFSAGDEGVDKILKLYPMLAGEILEHALESVNSNQGATLENNFSASDLLSKDLRVELSITILVNAGTDLFCLQYHLKDYL